MIPLFDMKRQYSKLRAEILNAVDSVFSSGRVILGPNVSKFEEELSEFLGVECAVGVSSGTDALILALKALDLNQGDVVLTTPFTFVASASSAVWVNAIPAFVDVDPHTMNMNLDELERVLSGEEGGINPDRIKAIVAVHLFGRVLDLERLEEISKKYEIPIVEDVAQAFGAEWEFSDGRIKKAGSVGKIGAFSFFPTKNLGAYGDGGALTTNDPELCERLRMLRAHGSKIKYEHEMIGKNARLDEVQAAILRVKLRYVREWNERRKEIAKRYSELLQPLENLLEFSSPPKGNEHVFHQYVVKFKTEDMRKAVIEAFKKRRIGFAIYYPKPLHLQKALEYVGYREGDFPVSEDLSKKVLALPMFPELEDHEIEEVVTVMKNALEGYR